MPPAMRRCNEDWMHMMQPKNVGCIAFSWFFKICSLLGCRINFCVVQGLAEGALVRQLDVMSVFWQWPLISSVVVMVHPTSFAHDVLLLIHMMCAGGQRTIRHMHVGAPPLLALLQLFHILGTWTAASPNRCETRPLLPQQCSNGHLVYCWE